MGKWLSASAWRGGEEGVPASAASRMLASGGRRNVRVLAPSSASVRVCAWMSRSNDRAAIAPTLAGGGARADAPKDRAPDEDGKWAVMEAAARTASVLARPLKKIHRAKETKVSFEMYDNTS